ncbi:CG0192-related protein, partial [Cryobacterium roopkundense]|uniref:Maltokinase N-terminal cap domain-containing protein n=1 Tax=Cryobacterium roopkundense TaxID=1001240 RepID=A0A7W8ZVE7_9MICO
MALLYQAELRPTKTELLSEWAPTQPWFVGEAAVGVTSVTAFRLDDPAGEVGLETILLQAGSGPVMHVPVTYRGAPLEGAEAWLVGTMEHSVLGHRWVYDATGDPVYLAAVATAALTGSGQAEQYVETNGQRVLRASTAIVAGSGQPGSPVPSVTSLGAVSTRSEGGATRVAAGALRFAVAREVGTLDADLSGDAPHGILTVAWAGQPEPRTLVQVWGAAP